MTSTFTTNKTLELPANGDYVNTWNIPVNSDMTVIDTALGGTTSLNATAGSATLTYTQYRPLILSVSGAVSANVTYTIPSGVGGQWIVRNAMTDSSGGPWDLIFASGGGGTSVIVSRGYTTTIYSDGTNISYSDSRLSTAAGSNRQIQYNNNGVLGASSTFVYDTGGNVGIGGTPSAWANGSYALQVGSGASMFSNNVVYSYFSTNGYFDGTNWRYIGTGASAQYVQSAGANIWYYAASGTAGNTFAWQEAMRIDASGNVGIGTGSPATKLTVQTSALGDAIRWTDNINSTGILATASGVSTMWTTTALGFGTGGGTYTERMRIDSSGNVGIGTASPAEAFNVKRGAGVSAYAEFAGNNNTLGTTSVLYGQDSGSNGYFYNRANAPVIFGTNNTERMRINSDGNLNIGAAGGGVGKFSSHGGSAPAGFFENNGTTEIMNISNSSNTSFTAMRFIVNAFTTVVGSISCSTSATSFNTSSDYRLKNSVTPMTSGLAAVSALKPVTYKWNADNSNGEGFIAHELAEIIPLAVTGEKDAVDKDGKIQPQGVDYSKVVVHLVAALQELSAKNDALEDRLAKLENAQ